MKYIFFKINFKLLFYAVLISFFLVNISISNNSLNLETDIIDNNNIIISNDNNIKNNKCIDSSNCIRMYYCNKDKKCVHKNVFPLKFYEILSFIFIALSYGISNLCGVGGGTVGTSTLLWVENFSTSEAVPITMFVMVFASSYTFYLGALFKKNNPDVDFVSYKAASVLIPMILIGSKFGSIFNYIMPFIVITFSLFLLVIYQILNIKKKYKIQIENENNNKIRNIIRESNRITVSRNYLCKSDKDINKLSDQLLIDSHLNTKYNNLNIELNNISDYKKIELEYNTENSKPVHFKSNSVFLVSNNFEKNIKNTYSDNNSDEKVSNLSKLKDILIQEDNPFNVKWIKIIVLTFLIYLITLAIEGNTKFPSLIGLEHCSFLYFVFLFFSVIVLTAVLIKNRNLIKESYLEKCNLHSSYFNQQEEYLFSNNNYTVLINSFFAGFIGSSLGIGGGMIISPYLISLGFSPKTSTTTSTLTIIFSSLSSTIIFITMGNLNLNYALIICFPSMISCYICSKFINNYIKNTGKQSILLYILFWILIVTLFFIVFSVINKLSYIYQNKYTSIFKFNNYCEKK